MSKKSKGKRPGGRTPPPAVSVAPPPRARRAGPYVAALLAACALLTAGYAATHYDRLRLAVGMHPLLTPAAPQQTPLPLAKEYVYAGGRLVATEEPTPAPTPTPVGSAPTNLEAKASLPGVDTAEVRLMWAAPSPAPLSYVVERASVQVSSGAKTDYAPLGQPVTTPPTQAAPYLDPSPPSQGMVYAYRVKALYAGGASAYSNQDVATTFRYTGDDPLASGSLVRAANLTELRAVVAAVRTLAEVGATTWKENPPPRMWDPVVADHFAELRTQLNPALEALGISPMPSDESIASTQPVKKEHVQDVRNKVR